MPGAEGKSEVIACRGKLEDEAGLLGDPNDHQAEAGEGHERRKIDVFDFVGLKPTQRRHGRPRDIDPAPAEAVHRRRLAGDQHEEAAKQCQRLRKGNARTLSRCKSGSPTRSAKIRAL